MDNSIKIIKKYILNKKLNLKVMLLIYLYKINEFLFIP